MSLFSRISRLIRANINFRGEVEQDPPGSFYEDFRRKQQSRTSETRGDDAGYHEGRAGGIKDDPELARYYANLEVPYGSDLATVTRAWKALLKRYHPDKHSTDPEKQRVANDLVQQLNHAYEQLRRHLQR